LTNTLHTHTRTHAHAHTVGASVTLTTALGENLVHLCVAQPKSSSSARSLLKLAIEAGVPLNTLSREGNSALYEAVARGHTDSALMLLKAGADPNVESAVGDMALHRASTRAAAVLLSLLCC